MMRGRVILAMLAVLAIGGGTVAPAAGASPTSRRITLHLKFQRVTGGDVLAVLGSKQYMLALLGSGNYRVYDDGRRKSWIIDTRPCPGAAPDREPYGGMFGAPWVLFICSRGSPPWALYNVVDRRWQRIGQSFSGSLAFRDADQFEVGAVWIKLVFDGGQDCGDHIHFDCGETYRFYNIRSRTFRSSPQMSSSTVFDLDSPQLIRHLCEPIQAPPVGLNGPMGTLAVLGRFAIEFTPYDIPFLDNLAPEVLRGRVPSNWGLEHCGSKSRLSIDTQNQGQYFGALTANDRAVLWSVVNSRGTWSGRIAGQFLPSLRRFAGSIPRAVADSTGGAVVDSSGMYVVTNNGALWRAAFPTEPAQATTH